jgi:hypothetical protein
VHQHAAPARPCAVCGPCASIPRGRSERGADPELARARVDRLARNGEETDGSQDQRHEPEGPDEADQEETSSEIPVAREELRERRRRFWHAGEEARGESRLETPRQGGVRRRAADDEEPSIVAGVGRGERHAHWRRSSRRTAGRIPPTPGPPSPRMKLGPRRATRAGSTPSGARASPRIVWPMPETPRPRASRTTIATWTPGSRRARRPAERTPRGSRIVEGADSTRPRPHSGREPTRRRHGGRGSLELGALDPRAMMWLQ